MRLGLPGNTTIASRSKKFTIEKFNFILLDMHISQMNIPANLQIFYRGGVPCLNTVLDQRTPRLSSLLRPSSPRLFENEYTRRASFSACSAGRVYSSLARKGFNFSLSELLLYCTDNTGSSRMMLQTMPESSLERHVKDIEGSYDKDEDCSVSLLPGVPGEGRNDSRAAGKGEGLYSAKDAMKTNDFPTLRAEVRPQGVEVAIEGFIRHLTSLEGDSDGNVRQLASELVKREQLVAKVTLCIVLWSLLLFVAAYTLTAANFSHIHTHAHTRTDAHARTCTHARTRTHTHTH